VNLIRTVTIESRYFPQIEPLGIKKVSMDVKLSTMVGG